MKKIVILTIALLSTGIVVSETLQKKEESKPATLKIDRNAVINNRSVANDAIATAD